MDLYIVIGSEYLYLYVSIIDYALIYFMSRALNDLADHVVSGRREKTPCHKRNIFK
jgi:hypothetical protein